jgi:urease accessory protein
MKPRLAIRIAPPESVAEFPLPRADWTGKLEIAFRRDGDRSVVAARRHEGPLVVQKSLYPEGPNVCHVVLVHAPGGIAGGDHLGLDVKVQGGAHALLTTPAATKWYKSDGRRASQIAACAVDNGGVLEWLPQESILFDAAEAGIVSTVRLAGSAVYAGWEIICLGRRASGEEFHRGQLRQDLRLFRDGALLWNERFVLAGGDGLMRSPVGLRGQHVFGGMVVAAGKVPDEIVRACREIAPRSGEGGVTALPVVFSARYLGGSAEAARDYFENLRGILRPWYAGRPALRSRLWDT